MLLTEETKIHKETKYAIINPETHLIKEKDLSLSKAYDRVSDKEIVVATLFGSVLGHVRKNGTYIDSGLALPDVVDNVKPRYHSKPGLLLTKTEKRLKYGR